MMGSLRYTLQNEKKKIIFFYKYIIRERMHLLYFNGEIFPGHNYHTKFYQNSPHNCIFNNFMGIKYSQFGWDSSHSCIGTPFVVIIIR